MYKSLSHRPLPLFLFHLSQWQTVILHCGDRSGGGGREGGKELNSYNVMAACNGNLFFLSFFLKNIYTSKKHIKGDITTLPCLLLMQGSTEVRRHRVGWPLGWRRFQPAKTKATYRVNWRFSFFFSRRSIRLIMRRRQRERNKTLKVWNKSKDGINEHRTACCSPA